MSSTKPFASKNFFVASGPKFAKSSPRRDLGVSPCCPPLPGATHTHTHPPRPTACDLKRPMALHDNSYASATLAIRVRDTAPGVTERSRSLDVADSRYLREHVCSSACVRSAQCETSSAHRAQTRVPVSNLWRRRRPKMVTSHRKWCEEDGWATQACDRSLRRNGASILVPGGVCRSRAENVVAPDNTTSPNCEKSKSSRGQTSRQKLAQRVCAIAHPRGSHIKYSECNVLVFF